MKKTHQRILKRAAALMIILALMLSVLPAAMAASSDWNNLQIDGSLDEVNSPCPIDEKFAAFGWNVISIDGHDFDKIDAAFIAAKDCKGKPTCIIAKTIKGKGVSFMEDKCDWHGSAPNAEQYEQAMAELDAALAGLEA